MHALSASLSVRHALPCLVLPCLVRPAVRVRVSPAWSALALRPRLGSLTLRLALREASAESQLVAGIYRQLAPALRCGRDRAER